MDREICLFILMNPQMYCNVSIAKQNNIAYTRFIYIAHTHFNVASLNETVTKSVYIVKAIYGDTVCKPSNPTRG